MTASWEKIVSPATLLKKARSWSDVFLDGSNASLDESHVLQENINVYFFTCPF
jgi:hypothetical protein